VEKWGGRSRRHRAVVGDHRCSSTASFGSDDQLTCSSGLAYTIEEAVRQVRAHRPDVVLLDYRLPDGDAPACIAQLQVVAPDSLVLVMTGLGDEATLAAARAAGCHGVVTKDRAAQDLVEGIRALASGVALTEPEPSAPRPGRKLPTEGGLSSREREVLTHLAAGQSTADIASAGISARRRNHIQPSCRSSGHARLSRRWASSGIMLLLQIAARGPEAVGI
jgi:FixJ family two-component response regulator